MQRLLNLKLGVACCLWAMGCTSNQQTAEMPQSETPSIRATSTEGTKTPNPETDSTKKPFKVQFQTTKGDFVVEVHPQWAPHGAARFRALVESGFYDDCRFFRVVPNFMVQFGINGDPRIQAPWRDRNIPDDPVKKSNTRGMVTFAKTGQPDSRSTQVFISYKDNSFLDRDGFAPFAEVVEGMDVVEAINPEYREQPDQQLIQTQGNAYLKRAFPNLDYIQSAQIVE